LVDVSDDADLPFPANHFDLVISRQPTEIVWDKRARVLRPGGSSLSQHAGAGSDRCSPQRAVQQANAADLEIVDLRQESLRTVFNDVAAVVYFLRKVIWTVPGFTVDGFRDRLGAFHEQIHQLGPFVAHAQRFLIEARKS
jgi:hypothetical protein